MQTVFDDADYATLSELAAIAGVSRQAAWNWSKRKEDFPTPASEGSNGPLYQVGDFRKWLSARGRAVEKLMAAKDEEEPGIVLAEVGNLSERKKKQMRAEIEAKVKELTKLAAELDTVRQPEHFFDPTNPSYMGRFTAAALLLQPRHPLSEIEKFYGSGVYALYYTGDFEPYQPLSGCETPIYLGKADPATPHAPTPNEQGETLSRRLKEHCKSINAVEAAGGISASDFEARYLVTSSSFQTTAELFLINYFRPIWNKEMKICFGIGKHGDDAKTRQNKKSPWDTLHPGRKWAVGNEPIRTCDKICSDIRSHFTAHPPVKEIDFSRLLLG